MTPQAWSARQAALRQYVFDCPTRYVLEATSEQQAREWFSDDADVEEVDCGPMLFGTPRLIAILPMGADVPEPQTALQCWAERLRAATRPLCGVTLRERVAQRLRVSAAWVFADVPVVALEDLRP